VRFVSTLKLALFKHQSAKVLGVVVSFKGTAWAGKDETNRKNVRVPRDRTPGSLLAGFLFSFRCLQTFIHREGFCTKSKEAAFLTSTV
jgi:hypothetical protein